jgi:aminopeptidase N
MSSPSTTAVRVLVVAFLLLQTACRPTPAQDSGGSLLSQQAAYDVTFYDLDVQVRPAAKQIAGTLTVHAVVQNPMEHLVLNLDARLEVAEAHMRPGGEALPVERRAAGNQVWIALPEVARPGDTLRVAVTYGGTPRTAPQPPWDGGFTWGQTPDGAPWIATSGQTEGADLWWPVKDHPSDEPDSMRIAVTVPDTLVAASNGVLHTVASPSDSTRTFHWHVSTPINTYGVALNIAPYTVMDTTYASTSGMDVPVSFYAVPSDSSRARSALPHFLDQVRFLEETLGPYPFRADKYGIAQTPFLGMEHQTIIAYGNDFNLSGGLGYDAGFDALHFHELAHEWYGNCLTVRDWKDFWLHEGVATYLEALYAESLRGTDGYRETTRYFRNEVSGGVQIARHEATSAESIYGRDVYYKGAMVLHTLRYVIGEDALRTLLRRFVYPTEKAAETTGGSQCRHVTTADFVQMAEAVSGQQLDGFFMAYLYQSELPRLETTRNGGTLTLRWTNTGEAPFPVPVPVSVDGKIQRVDLSGGAATLEVGRNAEVVVDPNGWILRAQPGR